MEVLQLDMDPLHSHGFKLCVWGWVDSEPKVCGADPRRQGHVALTDECLEWMTANCGPVDLGWKFVVDAGGVCFNLLFRNSNQMMLFKLTWFNN